jgi:hypothetical protein
VNASIAFSSSQPLLGEQHRVWIQAVRNLGLDLDPYTCKASYVCSMLRQFMEAAGLQIRHEYHLGAWYPQRQLLNCWAGVPQARHRWEAGYRLGSDRGSPNQPSTLLSKRVKAQIRSPVRVRT